MVTCRIVNCCCNNNVSRFRLEKKSAQTTSLMATEGPLDRIPQMDPSWEDPRIRHGDDSESELLRDFLPLLSPQHSFPRSSQGQGDRSATLREAMLGTVSLPPAPLFLRRFFVIFSVGGEEFPLGSAVRLRMSVRQLTQLSVMWCP